MKGTVCDEQADMSRQGLKALSGAFRGYLNFVDVALWFCFIAATDAVRKGVTDVRLYAPDWGLRHPTRRHVRVGWHGWIVTEQKWTRFDDRMRLSLTEILPEKILTMAYRRTRKEWKHHSWGDRSLGVLLGADEDASSSLGLAWWSLRKTPKPNLKPSNFYWGLEFRGLKNVSHAIWTYPSLQGSHVELPELVEEMRSNRRSSPVIFEDEATLEHPTCRNPAPLVLVCCTSFLREWAYRLTGGS